MMCRSLATRAGQCFSSCGSKMSRRSKTTPRSICDAVFVWLAWGAAGSALLAPWATTRPERPHSIKHDNIPKQRTTMPHRADIVKIHLNLDLPQIGDRRQDPIRRDPALPTALVSELTGA